MLKVNIINENFEDKGSTLVVFASFVTLDTLDTLAGVFFDLTILVTEIKFDYDFLYYTN